MRHIRTGKLSVIGLILAGSFACSQETVRADEAAAATDKANPPSTTGRRPVQ